MRSSSAPHNCDQSRRLTPGYPKKRVNSAGWSPLTLTIGDLAPRAPSFHRFLHEVCPTGDVDLAKNSQEDVIRYIEQHAQDSSPRAVKAMCWSLRAFLRYLHHRSVVRPYARTAHRFASGRAISMIAKAALDHVGIEGRTRRGAHIFRHTLATELLCASGDLVGDHQPCGTKARHNPL
jgi:integrase